MYMSKEKIETEAIQQLSSMECISYKKGQSSEDVIILLSSCEDISPKDIKPAFSRIFKIPCLLKA